MWLTQAGQTKEPKSEAGLGRYLHDRLSKILGAPVAQASLEGGADVVPVSARLVAILTSLPTKTAK